MRSLANILVVLSIVHLITVFLAYHMRRLNDSFFCTLLSLIAKHSFGRFWRKYSAPFPVPISILGVGVKEKARAPAPRLPPVIFFWKSPNDDTEYPI